MLLGESATSADLKPAVEVVMFDTSVATDPISPFAFATRWFDAAEATMAVLIDGISALMRPAAARAASTRNTVCTSGETKENTW